MLPILSKYYAERKFCNYPLKNRLSQNILKIIHGHVCGMKADWHNKSTEDFTTKLSQHNIANISNAENIIYINKCIRIYKVK